MKCLPCAKVKTAKGNVLHDSHAEVLAIRGFNRWLVDECADLARQSSAQTGEWLRRRRTAEEGGGERLLDYGGPSFELNEDTGVHMYCSEAPCGDASMELVMREQEDATPWDRPLAPPPDQGEENGMLGRGHFDQLGIVRRKPSRPDAPVTLSKSCSDKLALKQCTGLLSALTTRLVVSRGTWLSTLVLPESQFVPEAVERCFGKTGRMARLNTAEVQRMWQDAGHAYRPFDVLSTGREFEYSRRSCDSDRPVASNLSTIVTPHVQEILINGVLQGRKQEDPRGASSISRRRMWEGVQEVVGDKGEAGAGPERQMNADVKLHEDLMGRTKVKEDVRRLALQGWKRNKGDDEWTLQW